MTDPRAIVLNLLRCTERRALLAGTRIGREAAANGTCPYGAALTTLQRRWWRWQSRPVRHALLVGVMHGYGAGVRVERSAMS